MNHAISGEILVQEVRFPQSEIFLATLPGSLAGWFFRLLARCCSFLGWFHRRNILAFFLELAVALQVASTNQWASL